MNPIFTITAKRAGFYRHSSRYEAVSPDAKGTAIFDRPKDFAEVGDKVSFDSEHRVYKIT